MSFGEDDNKTMDPKAFTNFSIMSKMCLSFLKLMKPILGNRSMNRMKKSFSRRPLDYLSSIMMAVDLEEIMKALTK